MKCRRPFYNSKVRMLLHCLRCHECRRDRAVESAVANTIRQVRATNPPPAPTDLHAKLRLSVAYEPTRRAPKVALTLGTCAILFAFVLFFQNGTGGRRHETIISNGSGDHVSRSDDGSAIPAKVEHAKPGVKSGLQVFPKRHGSPVVARNQFVVRPKAREDELVYLNPGRYGTTFSLTGMPTKTGVQLPAMRDDFVAPPQALFASIGSPEELPEMARDAMEKYKQEAAVVDSRLVHNISLALKHASMKEVCRELSRQTGVRISAGRNVADENATLFVGSRPAREVMREISLVFGFIWDREGEDGAYSYRLKQSTDSLVEEEKLRNDDVTQAIKSLTRRIRSGSSEKADIADLSRLVFSELLPDEMDRLRSGQPVSLGTNPGSNQGMIDPQVSTRLLGAMGGIKLAAESYEGTDDVTDPNAIPFSRMRNPGVNLSLRMKLTEFGGAGLDADIEAYGTTDKFPRAGYGRPVNIGKIDGVAESAIDNAKANAALRHVQGMSKQVDFKPIPTVPLAEQTSDWGRQSSYPRLLQFSSYRDSKELQPPRPYMTSDDFWQSVHEATGRDVVADSFSRLFKLAEFKGQLFDVLSRGCDDMHVRWGSSDGWLIGRSRAYYWQRINEVPKEKLVAWSKQRRQNRDGTLPIEGVIEMSSLDNRQLDAMQVGLTIVNQWHLPEWGIVSRPLWPFGFEPVRPMVRFLGALPPDQLQAILDHKLAVSSVSQANLEIGGLADISRGAVLGVDYVPPGKFYWDPTFEIGKEEVNTDLIVGDTPEAVEDEIHKRYPDRPKGEVTLSDGAFTLIIYDKDQTLTRGDFRFGIGHRGSIGN